MPRATSLLARKFLDEQVRLQTNIAVKDRAFQKSLHLRENGDPVFFTTFETPEFQPMREWRSVEFIDFCMNPDRINKSHDKID